MGVDIRIHMVDGRVLLATWDAETRTLHCGPLEAYGDTLEHTLRDNIRGLRMWERVAGK